MTWLHAWHTLLATPMWIKLAAVASIALVAAFPAALAFVARGLRLLVGTELGRAVLLIVAAIVVCQFRAASAYADGRAAERADYNLAKAKFEARLAGQQRDASEAARAAERKHATELNAVSARYQQELADARVTHDRVVADLRRGALELRSHWTCPAGSAAPGAGGAGPNAGALLREQGAGDLVQVGAECDAQVRGLQQALRADRALKAVSP